MLFAGVPHTLPRVTEGGSQLRYVQQVPRNIYDTLAFTVPNIARKAVTSDEQEPRGSIHAPGTIGTKELSDAW